MIDAEDPSIQCLILYPCAVACFLFQNLNGWHLRRIKTVNDKVCNSGGINPFVKKLSGFKGTEFSLVLKKQDKQP